MPECSTVLYIRAGATGDGGGKTGESGSRGPTQVQRSRPLVILYLRSPTVMVIRQTDLVDDATFLLECEIYSARFQQTDHVVALFPFPGTSHGTQTRKQCNYL
jgi:hypothetical protein